VPGGTRWECRFANDRERWRTSRGTPRIANRLLRRVRDATANATADGALVLYGDRASANGAINGPLATAALAQLGIDQLGLDQLDRRYLAMVAERPVGIAAIASALSEQQRTIEDVVEPFLVQLGLVARTARGRVLTAAGFNHWRAHHGKVAGGTPVRAGRG
jgi:Holliday junction DNA helicase RuvB